MNIAFAICSFATVVIFISVSEAKTAAEISAEVAISAKKCAAEFKISEETLKELETTTDKTTLDASEDLKCFSKCLSDSIGLFVDGKLNIDRLIEVHMASGTEESKTRENVELCGGKFVEQVDCNRSWELYSCFHSKL